jgi:hypothetical protein
MASHILYFQWAFQLSYTVMAVIVIHDESDGQTLCEQHS